MVVVRFLDALIRRPAKFALLLFSLTFLLVVIAAIANTVYEKSYTGYTLARTSFYKSYEEDLVIRAANLALFGQVDMEIYCIGDEVAYDYCSFMSVHNHGDFGTRDVYLSNTLNQLKGGFPYQTKPYKIKGSRNKLVAGWATKPTEEKIQLWTNMISSVPVNADCYETYENYYRCIKDERL